MMKVENGHTRKIEASPPKIDKDSSVDDYLVAASHVRLVALSEHSWPELVFCSSANVEE